MATKQSLCTPPRYSCLLLILIGGAINAHFACAQNFVPATSLSGNPNPPQAYDIINNNPNGNVGIGVFPTRPNPDEKLTVGGNVSLWPDALYPSSERKITAHDAFGLLGIYSKDFDQCQGAGIRLNGVNAQNAGMVDLFSTGTSTTGGQFPAFLFTTYEPCLPYRRMVITRNGLAGFGNDIDGLTLDPNDRLSVDNSLALISNNDAEDRYIRGHSTMKSLNIMVGSSPMDGAGIELFGSTNPGITSTPYTPSGITFTAMDYHPNTQNAVAYKFMHGHPGAGAFMSFCIDQMGNARFGPNVPASERVSVDGDLYLVPVNGGSYRNIVAHANNGGGLYIAANTNQLDGSRIQLTGGTYDGQLIFNAIGQNSNTRAFTFNTKNSGTGLSSDKVTIENDGHMHLSNDLDFGLLPSGIPAIIRGPNGNLHLYSHSNDGDGSGIHLLNSVTSFVSGYGAGATTTIYSFQKMNAGSYEPLMSIHNDGKVVIGDDNTIQRNGTYKLYVADGIMTPRINVALVNSGAWHDEVFDENYQLMSLKEIEKYTTTNKHLPDVPSAEEVVKYGVDLGNMTSVLLKKVEELTLYAIQQQKIIEAQAIDIAALKKKLAEMPGQ